MTAVGMILLIFCAMLIWAGVTDSNLADELRKAFGG